MTVYLAQQVDNELKKKKEKRKNYNKIIVHVFYKKIILTPVFFHLNFSLSK